MPSEATKMENMMSFGGRIRRLGVNAIVVMGLQVSALSTHAASLEDVFGPGWQCPLMTNTLYKPGVVFEVNSSGAKRFVTDLSTLPAYSERVANASVGKFTSARSIDSGVYVSLLGRLLKGVTGSLGAGLGATSRSEIEFEIDRYVVTPPAVAKLALKQLEANEPNSGSAYYLVREAVAVKSMVYQIGDSITGNLGGEADVRRIVKAKVEVQGNGNNNYSLKAIFPEPMWACYTTDRLLPQRNIVGSLTWESQRQPPPFTDKDDVAEQ